MFNCRGYARLMKAFLRFTVTVAVLVSGASLFIRISIAMIESIASMSWTSSCTLGAIFVSPISDELK